jgi:hypothetical protein
MTRVISRQTVLAAIFGTSLALATLVSGCSTGMGGDMGGEQSNTTRDQVLRSPAWNTRWAGNGARVTRLA